MNTNSTAKQSSISATIGDNNQQVNIFIEDKMADVEVYDLIIENQKLRGLLDLALVQIKMKDRIIHVLTT